jgi:hypothetical protein
MLILVVSSNIRRVSRHKARTACISWLISRE